MSTLDAMNAVRVRPFGSEDYPLLVKWYATAYAPRAQTESEMRHADEILPPGYRRWRLVGLLNGEPVGYVEVGRSLGSYHPARYVLEGGVQLECRSYGVGRALYAAAERGARKVGVERLRAQLPAVGAGRTFLERRGLKETKQDWEFLLNLREFDAERFASAEAASTAGGVSIAPLSAFLDSPAARHRLHDLFSEVRRDAPRSEPASELNFEFFEAAHWVEEGFTPDAWMIAVAPGVAGQPEREWIGLSALWFTATRGLADTGLKAVRRTWRRRGVVTALKVRALRWAREVGFARVRTGTDSLNVGMAAVNDQVGFQRRPAWVSLARDLHGEDR